MADLYIGEYGKQGAYLAPTTNFEDHKVTFNFDGCKFYKTDDALYIGLHCTSVEGASKGTKVTPPYSILLVLHTKAYEYESGYGDSKKKVTQEPTNREKLLYAYLTGDDPELNYEKNEGKGGFLSIGASANDAPILAGDGNAKKHARFVLEFDDDIKPFDMSDDSFRLDNLAANGGKAYSKGSGRPAETEAQKIEARLKAIKAMVIEYKALSDDATPEVTTKALKQCLAEPQFGVLACLALGLPIPNNFTHWEF